MNDFEAKMLLNKDKIIQLYTVDKLSLVDIGKLLGVGDESISKYLHGWGIRVRNISSAQSIVNENKLDIIKLHGNGYSCVKIAELYEISATLVVTSLKKWGIDSNRPTYECNHNFFNIIDTEEKAYWLNIIAADGWISGNTLCFGLKGSDESHLVKYLIALSSNHIIYHRIRKGGYKQVQVNIGSPQLVQDLAKYGVVPAKSLILKPYIDLRQDLTRHGWRGFVDGDGSLGYRKSKKWSYPHISLYGTELVCTEFLNFCKTHINTKVNIYKNRDNLYQCMISGKNSIPIIDLLYSDATIYLDRKYEIAMDILSKWG